MSKKKHDTNINIKNRKAFYEFEILDKYTAGMVLKGTEIKSIREGQASIKEAFCYISDSSMYLKNAHIAEYSHGSHFNHEPKRERKLLLNKQEINKIQKKMKDVGLTIVPLKIFLSSRGFAKIEIAVAKGKKLHDKRDSIKSKDVKRDMERGKY